MNPTVVKLPFQRCSEARGAVVVIDVLRAFSTAAYAFSRGADVIFPVSTPEEALSLKKENPDLILMGEEHLFPIPGFDFGNSPADVAAADLEGRQLVQRTSAGTQGLVSVPATDMLFATSFVCAKATAAAIKALAVDHVSFIITGTIHGNPAQEDEACADYITALLEGEEPDLLPYLIRLTGSHAAKRFLDPTEDCYAPGDVALCSRVNAFPFAMRAVSMEGRLALRMVTPG
ncbi:MAG: 2-phosphosulfolactate phosphatase [Chthoniobacterales bacterium]